MLVFGRQDYADRAKRINESRMEFTWEASASLGPEAAVFTSARFDGNYGPLSGFCFDQFCRYLLVSLSSSSRSACLTQLTLLSPSSSSSSSLFALN